MKREKLLEALEEAVRTEESATTIYVNHIKVLSVEFPMKDQFIKKFLSFLDELVKGNKIHKKACLEMIDIIKKENESDY